METLPEECGILDREPTPEERDRLHEVELIVVLDPDTFPFREFRDMTRDVPLAVVSGQDRTGEIREWIGPFDRIVVLEDTETPASTAQRLFSETEDISGIRRAKTVHRVNSEAVGGVLDAFLASVEAGTRTFEVSAEDAPSLVPDPGGDHMRCTAEEMFSESLPDSGFDAGVCAGLLRHSDPDHGVRVIAGAWHAVKPGGRIVLVEEFVFDRERKSGSPASVSGYVEDVFEATDGRVTLDFMRSLKYPPDEVYRAAVFSFLKL